MKAKSFDCKLININISKHIIMKLKPELKVGDRIVLINMEDLYPSVFPGEEGRWWWRVIADKSCKVRFVV